MRQAKEEIRKSKEQELSERIVHFSEACKLDSWHCLVDEVKASGEVYAALATGRAELIKLAQPKALSADEAKVLLNIIATLISTNTALRSHTEQLAQLVNDWASAFKALATLGGRIQRFANFDREVKEDDE